MAHYAFINADGIVVEVIPGVDESELIEGLPPEDWYASFRGMECRRTSYNTRGGVHYGPDGEPSADQSKAFRMNYAGLGYTFAPDLGTDGAFIPAQPYPSWTLDTASALWEPPVPMPRDGTPHSWDESTLSWVSA